MTDASSPGGVHSPLRRRVAPLLAVAALLVAGGCAPDRPPTTPAAPSVTTAAPAEPVARPLATEPTRIADDLAADERVLRDPGAPEPVLAAAAHRQQAAYRILGRHPEWDPITRPRIEPSLLAAFDHNLDAGRQLTAMGGVPAESLPAWRIVEPAPADELLRLYREAQAASGVDWAHLAAINLIETRFGRIDGVSTAGAQGPMQFLPSTFAIYGGGGDIRSPRDSIMAAGRFLAAQGFARDRDAALYRYNNSDRYVRAVNHYAAVIAADPAAFAGYYRWGVYVNTTAGDVVLPTGYHAPTRLPVTEFLAQQGAPAVRISRDSELVLERLLAARHGLTAAGPAERSAALSQQFLGTPYRAHSLIGSATAPEELVAELAAVDCFTYVDYVEALKRAENREQFIDALVEVRYRNGVVGFANRKHFFTDWSSVTPAVATDITATLSPNAVRVPKRLNQKDSGGPYLPGLPVVSREVTQLPSRFVDDGVLGRLQTGDYIGAYADDGGLDVTHVGIFVAGPDGPVLRNASSLSADNKVVDTPLPEYLRTVPGIVVLRPVL